MVTDLNAAQSKIFELGTLLEKLYSTARSPHPGNMAETHEVNKTIRHYRSFKIKPPIPTRYESHSTLLWRRMD